MVLFQVSLAQTEMAFVAAQAVVKRCHKQPLEDMSIHCFECNVDTCKLCIQTTEHANHKWGSIGKIKKRKRAETIQNFDQSREKISSFQTRFDDAKTMEGAQQQMIEGEMTVIQKHSSLMIKKIKEMTDKTLALCKERQSKRASHFNAVSAKFDHLLAQYNSLIDTFQEDKVRVSDDDVIAYGEALEEILTNMESFKMDEFKEEILQFTRGEVGDQLSKMFGRLKIKSPNLKAKLKGKFPFGKGRVSCLYPVAQGAWIRNHYTPSISLIDCEGKEITKHATEKGVSAFLEIDECLLYTEFKTKFIGKINEDGKKEMLLSTSPAGLGGLCRNLEDDQTFYVCFTDNSTFHPSAFAERSVAKVSLKGEILQKIEFCGGNRLFNHPYRVYQNYNMDLCVVDRCDLHTGVVHAVESLTGRLKFTYKGQVTNHPFNPCGVACDENCRIIISDCKNKCIHLVDEDGNFLKFFINENDGLTSPWSVAMYNDTLWVGDELNMVTTYTLTEM